MYTFTTAASLAAKNILEIHKDISNLSVDLYTGPHMSALSSVAMLKDVYKIENADDQMLLAATES